MTKGRERRRNRQHICVKCRHKFPEGQMVYGPDPFDAEINNDSTKVWECERCNYASADEV